MSKPHRAGFIGAGYISAFHAAAVRRIPNVTIAGVYDVDVARAESVARALNTRAVDSLERFRELGVDVLHVLTPPDTHAEMALRALDLGAHVLVEKPLATDVNDCVQIAQAAQAKGLRVSVDHSLLYDVQIRRAIERVRSGAIGRLVSMHSLRSADYPPYEGGALPPQYRSAGYPFRDLGVHQLYLAQAFLGRIEDVRASWESLGGDPNLTFDEWRADVRCRNGCAAINISFNVRPIGSVIVLQGTKGMLYVDQMRMFSTLRRALPIPKAAERAINAYCEALQMTVQVAQGSVGFLTGRVRQFHGVQEFVAEFYRTLDAGLPVPVSIEDAIPVVDWVERVARAADDDAAQRSMLRPPLAPQVPILVTGAAGALGSAIVSRLHREGHPLRVFVRRDTGDFPPGVEVATGDLGDPQAVNNAVRGARVVVHAGAAMKGGWITHRASTVVGTQNVIDACLRHGVDQLVYISSLSVVNLASNGAPISERSELEPRAEARGAYTRAKLEAELLVREGVERRSLRAVILRPGQIFGGTLPLLNAAVARKLGKRHIVLGDGSLRLPLVYIDDVVDAVCAARDKHLVSGEIVQLVDSALPTQNEIVRRVAGKRARIVRVPHWFVFSAGWLSEIACRAMGRSSPLSRYRLRSALTPHHFTSENAQRLLSWEPRVGVTAGIEREIGNALG